MPPEARAFTMHQPMPASVAIQSSQLCAHMGATPVLQGIDLKLPVGRWSSIVGPNGAGKSTLLKALAGLLPARQVRGQVQLLGRPLHTLAARQRACQLAWLGQNESVAGDLPVYEVVMLGRLPHRPWLAAPTAHDHAAVQQALRATQAWPWRDRLLAELSGGERQRVLLARALAVQAAVTLMDEPLANLDPPHQSDWLLTVRSWVSQGATIVSVLHEISMALQADDMVIVAAGRVVHHGACSDAATHRALEQVFERRIRVRHIDGFWVALPQMETPMATHAANRAAMPL